MNLLDLARSRRQPESRYSLEQYAHDVSTMFYGGQQYQGVNETWQTGERSVEKGDSPFETWARGAYKANGIVFACSAVRARVFSSATFQFQRLQSGRPGDLFGTPDLALLETPWPNGQTNDLLSRMIQDVDLAGNAFVRGTTRVTTTDGGTRWSRLERLRPDWVWIVLGTNSDLLSAEVVGYAYVEGGTSSQNDPVFLSVDEVAHWAPQPDPLAGYRGMSWLTPVPRGVRGDSTMVDHKGQFFDHAATPNMVIKFDSAVTKEKAEAFKTLMETEHAGFRNAYKNMCLAGGADVTVVGNSLKDMDYRAIQGAGETRIAAAAGVPPIIVGLSEGLDAATYSNYAQARRAFADLLLHPLWGSAAAALSRVVRMPPRARLWYDHRHVPLLREDSAAAAAITKEHMLTIESAVRAGFQPNSAVLAIAAGDLTLLQHTGLYSVQLQPLGTGQAPAEPGPAPALEPADDAA